MATDISHGVSPNLFTSALSPQPAFHPAVEPRRTSPNPSQDHGPAAASEPVVLGPKDLQHAIVQMNELVKVTNHRLSFSMDYETNDVIVKVIDVETEKVIKELPAAELQKLHKSIREAVGLLFDKLI
jgi:flagellar protein FlaG